MLGPSVAGQLSLTVKTLPADADAAGTRIARELVTNLRAVGVDARIELQPARELQKDVLLGGNYDVYVGRFPNRDDPDFLRPLLHSVFEGEAGWQNPFGFTDIAVDDLLSGQREAAGTERRRLVGDLQREIASKQPFGILAFPNEIWAVRNDRFDGWSRSPLTEPASYVALQSAGPGRQPRLRVTTTDAEPTRNLNPLAVQHRSRGIFTGLLYDPLARRVGGAATPWLAADWSWHRERGDAVGTVRLRPDLTWHDGTALTADDVAFTYRFLNDTLLGAGDTAVPAPRFRGRSSLVGSVTAENERTVTLRCPQTSPTVAMRALTVPVLPAHVWADRAVQAGANWSERPGPVTEALLTPNVTPVGSGVVQFEGRAEGESLVLTRFEDHFLHRATTPGVPDVVVDGVPFDRLSVRVVPSDDAAIQLLSADEADGTAMRIGPDSVPRVGQDDALTLHVEDGRSFYHVGFNTRREPLGNPHVRRAIVRLLDKEYVAESVFDGFARPATSALTGTDWVPTDLVWDGTDPTVPFVGEEGTLDESGARELFREAGLEYDDEGRVIDR